MGDIKKELEDLIEVGSVVSLHVTKARYQTTVCGWQKHAAILLARPIVNSRMLALWHNQNCTVRFLSDGNACGFNALVIDWDNRPRDPLFRITWPAQVEVVPFRHFERIQVTCPCQLSVLNDAPTMSGTLCDLSIGGCRVGTAQAIPEGTAILLDFALPDGFFLEQIAGTVCSARPSGNGASETRGAILGIEFARGQDHVLSDVAFFVRTTLGRSGRWPKPACRVLILDDQLETSDPLLRAFEDQECEVTTASGLVDGFFRLRVVLPNVLLINQQLHDLQVVRPDAGGASRSGVSPGSICAMIRQTRGFENLPIFIYGAKDEDSNAVINHVSGPPITIFTEKDSPLRIADRAIGTMDLMS